VNVTTAVKRALILASESPRRLALLEAAGFDVTVSPAGVPETWPAGGTPETVVVELALRKARAVAAWRESVPVLGADTTVVIGDRALGKPVSREEAAQMLALLSGNTHTVFTGVALCYNATETTGVATSEVRFRDLSTGQIGRYLDAAQYLDKAGAYGIQEEGADLVASYRGRLDTIIGLPMDAVESMWQRLVADRL
jgi:septum formation protein